MGYTLKQLEDLFVQADDAGNAEDAQAFLEEIDKRKGFITANRAMYSAQQGEYAPVDPTAGERGTDLRVEGFGRAINATGLGIGQRLGLVDQKRVDEAARIDEPLLNNGNGAIGNVASQMTQVIAPGTAIARTGLLAPKLAALSTVPRLGANMALAGTENAAFASTQPVVSGDTLGGNMAGAFAWGAGGKLAQGAVGQAAKGGSNLIVPYMAKLQEEAAKRGITLGVQELTNNPMVQTTMNQLSRLPLGGGASRVAKNKEAVNAAVARTFGEETNAITSDVYASAKQRLSGNYDKIKANNPLPLTKPLIDDLSAIQADAQSKSFSGAGGAIKGWIDDIVSKADENGNINGAAFKSLESQLGNLAKTGGESGYYLGQLRDTLRNHWQDSVSKAGNGSDIELLKSTNSQYGALKTIRDLVAKEGGDGISPQGLMGRVTANNAGKERMAMGNGGELGTLARIGQKLKPPPNSGTADRALVNFAIGSGLYGAQDQGYISPELALLMGGGLLANRALNSNAASRYVAQGLPKPAQGLLTNAAKPLPYALPALASTKAAAEDSKKKKKKR